MQDGIDLSVFPNSLPIPKEFFSTNTGAPFDRCMMCNKFLLAPGTPYIIEKAVRQHLSFELADTVFEFAMCQGCAMQMARAMSEESMRKVHEYFSQVVDFDRRRKNLLSRETRDLDDWAGRCLVNGTPKEDLKEYQMVGMFSGEFLVLFDLPYLIGGEAMADISMLMSNKTLGEMDDFMKNFGIPPELRELFKDKPLVLV